MKMTLFAVRFDIFWMTSRYRICIADEEPKIYAVSLSNLADSTSALAEMMVAYDTLFWMAADCKFFWTSSDSITSKYHINSTFDENILNIKSPRKNFLFNIGFQLMSDSWTMF